MLCSKFLRHGHGSEKPNRVLDLFETLYQKSHRGYVRSLDWVMDRRPAALAFSMLILIATGWLAVIVPKGFIPSEDTGQLMGTTETAEGTSFASMTQHQLDVMRIAGEDPSVQDYYVSLGSGGRSSNQGRLMLHLKPRSARKLNADQVARQMNVKLAGLPGIRVFLQNPPVINIGGRFAKSVYQYTLQGSDVDELYRVATALELKLRQNKELTDVTSDLQIKNPEVHVEIDRDRASAMGVTANQIESALYNAYGARQVSTIYTDVNQYWVVLELLPEYQRDLDAFKMLSIRSPKGDLVPLAALAKITEGVGPLAVNHSGQRPSVTLSFNLPPGVAIGDAVKAVETVAAGMLPVSVTGSFVGQAQAFKDAQHGLLILLLLALAVIYIVLGILYESFVHPITILTGLPFAGFGALLTLVIFHQDLSIYAFVGVIMLIGLVKKNAIMMIDFALDAERAEGKSPRAAILEACSVRFRPIMMTTMAALMGTLPIALGAGAGAESRRPLGLAVVGGLAFSQLVTLYVTPVFYTYLDELRSRVSRKRRPAEGPVGGLQPAPIPRSPE
jgi:HAE1 family hydrophobic/amphiphilic exporter-1